MYILDSWIFNYMCVGGNKMGFYGLIEVEKIWISRFVMRWDEIFM